jgi:D-xylose transport system substrate-binding protein
MAMSLASCGGDDAADMDSFTVGLLLPSRAVPRWEHADKPFIEQRLKELCPRCTVEYVNAENDAARQRQQMMSMITKGVEVLILDAADTRAIRSSIQEARKADIPVVSYDRLAEGPISGYVTVDGGQVGRLQGEALLTAMDDRANGENVVMLNGDPTSPNAAWYKRGALSVMTGKVTISRSYDTLGWSKDNAHTNMLPSRPSAPTGSMASSRPTTPSPRAPSPPSRAPASRSCRPSPARTPTSRPCGASSGASST